MTTCVRRKQHDIPAQTEKGGDARIVQQGKHLPRGLAAPGTPDGGNVRVREAPVQIGGLDLRRRGGVAAGRGPPAGKGWTYPNHNPHFAADPEALPLAAAVEAQAAYDYLRQEEGT